MSENYRLESHVRILEKFFMVSCTINETYYRPQDYEFENHLDH